MKKGTLLSEQGVRICEIQLLRLTDVFMKMDPTNKKTRLEMCLFVYRSCHSYVNETLIVYIVAPQQ